MAGETLADDGPWLVRVGAVRRRSAPVFRESRRDRLGERYVARRTAADAGGFRTPAWSDGYVSQDPGASRRVGGGRTPRRTLGRQDPLVARCMRPAIWSEGRGGSSDEGGAPGR